MGGKQLVKVATCRFCFFGFLFNSYLDAQTSEKVYIEQILGGESDFEVHLSVAPPDLDNNVEKQCATQKLGKEFFSTSKNEMSGIARNAFSQSFVAIGADFEG